MSNQECFACGETTTTGLKICGQYLCRACEEKLARTRAGKLDYQHWIDSCHRFWEKLKIDLEEDRTDE